MERNESKVVFANAKMEQEYQWLATSTHPKDRETYMVLQDIRRLLLEKHRSGHQIPKNEIPDVYQRLFQVRNLWSQDLPRHGTVLYSMVGEQIWIVDII